MPGDQIIQNPEFGKKILKKIHTISADLIHPVKLMHVCGTHEHTLAEYGLRSPNIIPKNVEIISGPGCPVCVCPAEDIDRAIELTKNQDIILTTFGDMIRVPSTHSSLSREKAKGADIRIVYGPADAIKIAQDNPNKEIVFFAIGFETTAPLLALELANNPPSNFTVLSAHKLIPPAMELMISLPDFKLDGFICPGHVATIIGMKPFIQFSEKHNFPNVIAGFEPNDMLLGIYILLTQIKNRETYAINEYTRVVRPQGNQVAQEFMKEVYGCTDSKWRGIGLIPNSGLELKEKYQQYDALKRFEIPLLNSQDIPKGCSCHLVLVGKKKPEQCPLFAKKCTPINPVGPCMVGNEGSCRISYMYRSRQ
ncbi:MAG: hydrogenase formation protein HypD [Candidatus Lokiarchaeota archaeon]|nr:hydrogenase formation protein HypD [Candidatus Lokiarchaeota archaeon]